MSKVALIVDDSADDQALCMAIVQKAVANRVLVVGDGSEAIAYLIGAGIYSNRRRYPLPDVLLLDLKMPKVDGFAVLEWLKSQPNFKPLIVVLSQFGQTKEVTKAYAMGAHTFLNKPLRPEDIVNLTRHFGGYWEQHA
jgi:CheY-like chemotaxis protein